MENNHVNSTTADVMDVSVHPICWILSCPLVHFGFCPYRTILTLEKEEAIRHDRTICGERTSHVPYGELGSVETGQCCCFICVDSALGTIVKGFGCDQKFSDELAKELKMRMAARGDTGQIKISEQVLAKATQVREKVELIEQYFNHAATFDAPTANEMNER